LVTMEIKKNLISEPCFLTTNITMNIIHCAKDDTTISTHFLEWKCSKASYGQHLDYLKNKK
jgi:hypothetical protein